jgi:hypothetical protein
VWWGALLIGTTVGLHVEEADALQMDEAIGVVDRLGTAIERHTGASVVLDDTDWAKACRSEDVCLAAVKARTQADIVISLRLLGGLSRIRLIADRHPSDRSVLHDLPRDPEAESTALDSVAKGLFPEGRIQGEVTRARSSPKASISAVTWILFGAGGVALIAGSGFGLSSNGAGDEIDSNIVAGEDYRDLRTRMHDHGVVANVLFAAAGVSIISGLVWGLAGLD